MTTFLMTDLALSIWSTLVLGNNSKLSVERHLRTFLHYHSPLSHFMRFTIISVCKVHSVLAFVKFGKASGPDCIPVWFLQELAS